MTKHAFAYFALATVALLLGQNVVAADNYRRVDCEKMLWTASMVSLPRISNDMISTELRRDLTNSRTLQFRALRYPDEPSLYDSVHFAGAKNTPQELIADMATFWGVEDASSSITYWEAISRVVDDLERYPELTCGAQLSEQERMELIVLTMMAPEVLFSKEETTLVLTRDSAGSFYYLISKLESDSFHGELTIKLHEEIYTVTLIGKSREDLELFIAKTIALNT